MKKVIIPKRQFNKAAWHEATQTAHHIIRDYGIEPMTTLFNAYKLEYGITKRDRRAVTPTTIRRYINGGIGYENGPPSMFKTFIKIVYDKSKKHVVTKQKYKLYD